MRLTATYVTLIFGRWAYIQHHRGITHSIVGTLALALALPLVFYLVDVLIARARNGARRVRLRGLLLASIVVSATHPLMDWTNNYGVRFLLPWNSQMVLWRFGLHHRPAPLADSWRRSISSYIGNQEGRSSPGL